MIGHVDNRPGKACPLSSDGIHRMEDAGRSEQHQARILRCACGKWRWTQADEVIERYRQEGPRPRR